MGDIQSSQANVYGVAEGGLLRTSQVAVLAVAIKAAEYMRASQAQAVFVTEADMPIKASQLSLMAVARGRVNDPAIRAWWFRLDDHRFYVLRLGTTETLVCDLTTGEWFTWGTGETPLWRCYSGTNWLGAGALATNGSNIVVGDDANGAIYILDPEGDLDDSPLEGAENKFAFIRRITTQYPMRGYDSVPCFGIELLGSVGQFDDDSLRSVRLEVSDDRGTTYQDCGTVDTEAGVLDTRVDWRSLGSMNAPGRLFRITDYGALRRIDSLEMPEDEGNG